MLRFAVIEILPAAAFLVPVYLLLHKLYFRDARRCGLCFLFSFYLCAVYALVGLPNASYIRFDLSGNLIPFRDMLTGLRSTVQNVLLFVPLGVFLPLLWKKYRMCRSTVRFGFCMSLAIELLQMFTYRATDINDLITNTAGAFLGFLLARVAMRRFPGIAGTVQCKKDLLIVFMLPFIIMFFLYPVWIAIL